MDQRITFVIPSRNNLEFLQLAYKSIKNLDGKHEILVLDDASTDGTSDWIQSLNDEKLITYRNDGPERIGIVGMFDKGIQMARTPIIMAFHADMVASPNLDKNIIKHLKPLTVVSATRVEPPLHPSGPEKITLAWGNEVDEYDYDMNVINLLQLENQNKNKTTEGIFAPWCMYREDFLSIGGHDELFAPQSKEDSDLFNRFVLNGYKVIQSWDALVYHFTSRGSRFNKHSGGSAGVNSQEWIDTTTKNGRNFVRKWGHFVKHNDTMKPIVPKRYDVGFVVRNCDEYKLTLLEPWCDTIYTDVSYDRYINLEQKNTKFDLKKKLKRYEDQKINDIVIEFDAVKLTNQSFEFFNMLQLMLEDSGIVGELEFDIFKLKINKLNDHNKNLVTLNDSWYKNQLL